MVLENEQICPPINLVFRVSVFALIFIWKYIDDEVNDQNESIIQAFVDIYHVQSANIQGF